MAALSDGIQWSGISLGSCPLWSFAGNPEKTNRRFPWALPLRRLMRQAACREKTSVIAGRAHATMLTNLSRTFRAPCGLEILGHLCPIVFAWEGA